ncbi:hypothetical protein SIN8267_03007 [Sinobacterium norvegicum]|uniref:Uncharacterized protein n=1 Tax=Sinobacterium norvegicum TaxID=1641715 RepID=A0ABN8EKE0_9GAMM|nr:UPF0149 family protein [Sinobacterium norvegicum]CAH0992870.1 hypothetical protein SIN8267_03007 [Sinobacterium norvegicum]
MTTEYEAEPLDFDDVCDLLVELGSLVSAAEFHGSVSGMLAGCIKDKKEPDGGWPNFMAELIDVEYQANSLQQQELVEIGQTIANALTDESLSFGLLLPDEDHDVAIRIESLGHWCQGFLSGFAQSGITDPIIATWPDDAREALHDLAAIAQIGLDDEDDPKLEADYLEVSEYVRLAALHVFLECAGESNKGEADMDSADQKANREAHEEAISSVGELFNRGDKPLH